jgi:hypothetical protein
MRVCLLIPDGIGIRNYLYSDVLKHLAESGHNVVIWHSLPDEVIQIARELHNISIESVWFDARPDPFFIRLYREATTYARLRLNAREQNNPTILKNWNTKRNTWAKKLLYPLAEKLGSMLKTHQAIEKLEQRIYRLQQKTRAYKMYRQQLQTIQPDVLFCTHQRVPHVVSALLAAQNLGVKTATAIFSWDNLPKARLPIRADRYFVWSDHMKEELLGYYTDIEARQVHITGTPQFDFYRKPELIHARDDFANTHGLDPQKEWVLFSGDDKTTSPYDPQYLADIASGLQDRLEVQLLFRQVPVETVERYATVLAHYPNIVHVQPKWQKGEKWSHFYPLFDDIALLVNLAHHCAVVINIGSTMALDFSNFNKPALFVNYNTTANSSWSINEIYRFQHFKSMEGLKPVGWINSRDEIAEKVIRAMKEPAKIGPDRQKWFERIVQQSPNKTSSQQLVNQLVS